jgi:hypothetical protein
MRTAGLAAGAFALGFVAMVGLSQVRFLYLAWLHAGF